MKSSTHPSWPFLVALGSELPVALRPTAPPRTRHPIPSPTSGAFWSVTTCRTSSPG